MTDYSVISSYSSDNSACPKSKSRIMRYLPKTFVPSANEVVVGRGKRITNHVGNKRFKSQVCQALDEYKAVDKTEKSYIISKMLNTMRKNSIHGCFVKKDKKSGLYFVLGDSWARSTIAQAFRDELHFDYSSSKHAKQRKRWFGPAKADSQNIDEPMTVTSLYRNVYEMKQEEKARARALAQTPRSLQNLPGILTGRQQTSRDVMNTALATLQRDDDASHMGFSAVSLEPDVFFQEDDTPTDDHHFVFTPTDEDEVADNPFEPTPFYESPAISFMDSCGSLDYSNNSTFGQHVSSRQISHFNIARDIYGNSNMMCFPPK